MNTRTVETIDKAFSTCRRTLGSHTWGRVLAAMEQRPSIESFPDTLEHLIVPLGLPGYIADLARVELAGQMTGVGSAPPNHTVTAITVNPTLTLVPVDWKNLTALIGSADAGTQPSKEPAHVMIWQAPTSGDLRMEEAGEIDLLALKLVVEEIDPQAAAALGDATPGEIQAAIWRAVSRGLLLSPASRIRRPPPQTQQPAIHAERFLRATTFTLQWHVTQACDLHCKHCYDRSRRAPMAEAFAMDVLDGFFDFCRRMHVHGQVTFTGGNPLLYPHFDSIYRAAADFGFEIAILGNPTPLNRIRDLIAMARPLYFQISLEGLAEHNDEIRGKGHFARSLTFLDGLRDLGLYTMVMLTLTRANLDQVLPLAELLKDRADHFTFNRLSTVGEAANLLMPEKKIFESFLRDYVSAASKNPKMGLKDNLINIIREANGERPFGGCTGHGCGAAFNFLALLPDGEVHACRKFPSLIGNIKDHGLHDIYRGEMAQRYRNGSRACRDCRLNTVCRGCLAVAHSLGRDCFTDKDPFCFASPPITGELA